MFEKLRRRIIRPNRIYIMPTGRGFLFLAAVVVMILTAATYNNNLIFILAFFLFALFVVTMLQTHYNLKGVRLEYAGSEEAFEGDALALIFHLQQSRARAHQGLEIRALDKKFASLGRTREEMKASDTVRSVSTEVRAHARGLHAVPAVALETYWPVGLFRAWKVFRFEGQLIVYPRPEGDALLGNRPNDIGEEETGLRTTPDGDFGELKAYLPGESYHQIAWKHFARTGNLYTKAHWGSEEKHYVIPWAPNGDPEAHLRQMSRWVQIALDEGASFEMETPDRRVDAGRGLEQARQAWRALALVKKARRR